MSNPVKKISVQSISGQQKYDPATNPENEMIISVYQFNPKEFNDEHFDEIKACTSYPENKPGVFYYYDYTELPKVSHNKDVASRYHEVYKQELTIFNELILPNIEIKFIPLTYTIQVNPTNEFTYYHVQILKGDFHLEFTNLDQLMFPGYSKESVLTFFKTNFWPKRRVRDDSSAYQVLTQKNILLTMYLISVIQPVEYELPSQLTTINATGDFNGQKWLRVKNSGVQIASSKVLGVLYEPSEMMENQFSQCTNLQVFRINNNLTNIIKFIPSNALPQSPNLTIYVNNELQRVIMQVKYPRAHIVIDQEQYDTQGQTAESIQRKNRKQIYQNQYDIMSVSEVGQTATLTGSSTSIVVMNKYQILAGNWNNVNVRSIQINGDITDIENSISLPNIQILTIHNNRGEKTLNIKSNNFQNCTNLRVLKFQCKINVVSDQNVFTGCHQNLQVLCQYYQDIGKVRALLLNSGYTNPVVKLLQPKFFEFQYVSDTVSANNIGAANTSVSFCGQENIGLFIPDNLEYDTSVSIQNKGYYDIIVNKASFPLNTDTLVGNQIKNIYLAFVNSGRVYQQACFNNATLQNVYFMCPTVLSSFFQPGSGIDGLFTVSQRASVKVSSVSTIFLHNMLNANMLSAQDYTRYCAVQWPDNLINLSDFQSRISYTQHTITSMISSWVQLSTIPYSGLNLQPTSTNRIIDIWDKQGDAILQHIGSYNFGANVGQIGQIPFRFTHSQMGVSIVRFPATVWTFLNLLRFYDQLGIMYIDGSTNIQTSNFENFNASTFNVVLVPANQTIRDTLIQRGFPEKNILFNYVEGLNLYVEKVSHYQNFEMTNMYDQEGKLQTEVFASNELYYPRPLQYSMRVDNESDKFYDVYNYLLQDTMSLNTGQRSFEYNPSLMVKYSEWPVAFILKLYVNNVHVETLLTTDRQLNFEKLNKKQWLWTYLNQKSRVLKFRVEEVYYDGTTIIEKDEEDTIYPDLSVRMYVQ